MRCIVRTSLAVVLLAASGAPGIPGPPGSRKSADRTPVVGFERLESLDHDPGAYTQGLVFHEGIFYEGTGQHGGSRLQKYRYNRGRKEILGTVHLAQEHFGEGIAVLKGKVVQLTWQSGRGFVYQASDLKPLFSFAYPGEGWGLTTDGRDFYMSDGTSRLRVVDGGRLLDRREYAVVRTLEVKDQGAPVPMLNELEWIQGEIYANVWQTDRIAVISPKTGQVLRWIDLAGLLSPMHHTGADSVLNGIAYDAAGGRLFVTGKLWPTLFRIREKRGS